MTRLVRPNQCSQGLRRLSLVGDQRIVVHRLHDAGLARKIGVFEVQLASQAAGPGTAGLDSIKTTVLVGDPNKQGVYAVSLYVPPHTIIMAHTHRDDRTATVVSGTWYFGYGSHHDAAALRTLKPGSFYTEPARQPHFTETRDDAATLYITGFGSTDTNYVEDVASSGNK